MKNIFHLAILMIITFSLNSCVEDGETVEFALINKTEGSLFLIEYRKYNDSRDTVQLQVDAKLSIVNVESSGNVPHVPLSDFDTLAVAKSDTNFILYTYDSPGKHPFNLESWKLVETSGDKHMLYSKYEYEILEEDFNGK